MAVRGDWLFLVFSSIAVVVLRPRCSAEAYCSDGDADLAIYNKVAEVWNIGRCCLFLVSVIAGGRSGRFAYQLAEKPGWDLSPTFHGGSASLRGSSSSGGLEALVPVALDSSVSDDVRPGRSLFTKQVGLNLCCFAGEEFGFKQCAPAAGGEEDRELTRIWL
ncbi:uncharacterized protein LOC120707309 isoform X2 [Panicum virgatum]|uniref:uncharacterized protein LOC120707309 isoform X2 n=1 Tax=Panicum virgatum TaxID=38727 RepID=UPI0019D5A1E7|nr:uncharacterized protein LOC120707309 isoform X2 [Panicum virgatum]